MASTTNRSDIRTEVRDNTQEASGVTGAIFTDAVLNRAISRELRSLPKKGIYLEEIWTTPQVITNGVGQRDYALPDGWVKVDKLERNEKDSDTDPDWAEIKGWDTYGDTLWLPYEPTNTRTLRLHLRKAFTIPTSDTTLNIPDDKCEVLIWGVTVRCYKIWIGHLRGNKSFDSVTKPGDHSISVVQNWLRDAIAMYKDAIGTYHTTPRPRDIDMVGAEWSL